MIDFNNISIRLGLFYAYRLGNPIYSTLIYLLYTFLSNTFEQINLTHIDRTIIVITIPVKSKPRCSTNKTGNILDLHNCDVAIRCSLGSYPGRPPFIARVVLTPARDTISVFKVLQTKRLYLSKWLLFFNMK